MTARAMTWAICPRPPCSSRHYFTLTSPIGSVMRAPSTPTSPLADNDLWFGIRDFAKTMKRNLTNPRHGLNDLSQAPYHQGSTEALDSEPVVGI